VSPILLQLPTAFPNLKNGRQGFLYKILRFLKKRRKKERNKTAKKKACLAATSRKHPQPFPLWNNPFSRQPEKKKALGYATRAPDARNEKTRSLSNSKP
jgi:hypothetical protein